MRSIIHCDMNAFYASVEQAEHPELRGKPVIVGGDEEARQGIVLTASYEAKRQGVKTAMTLYEARKVCPEAIVVPAHFELYKKYARLARSLYYEYSDLVEPFGLDEAWIDITHTKSLFGNSADVIAREISERIKYELGVRASVGLSWNKIFAKFGSDYQKPDGYTVITPANMTSIVWPRHVRELLYVGRATARKLNGIGITTIGELACCDEETLVRLLGKPGLILKSFALGNDDSPVKSLDAALLDSRRTIKSIGNGITLPFDACDAQAAKQVIWLLGEAVSQRLRSCGLSCRCVGVSLKHASDLKSYSRQVMLEEDSNITKEICDTACRLALKDHDFAQVPIRALNVRVSQLVAEQEVFQLDVEGVIADRLKQKQLDDTVDKLRLRFGNHIVVRGIELLDSRLQDIDPVRDNTVHPCSYFG